MSDLVGNDLGRSYQDYLVASNEDRALQRLRSLAAGGSAEQPTPTEQAPPPERAPGIGVRVLRGAGTALRNVGEVPGQIVGGVLDGAREVFRAADDIANWMTGTPTPEESEATLGANPGRVIARNIPSMRRPETITGELTREGSQFLFGFWRGMGLLRGANVAQGAGTGAAAVRGLSAGAIADFFFNEADEGNLANAWTRAGLPPNALTDFLSTNPDDAAAENRLRNALAGAVVGGALEGVIATAKAARAASRARETRAEPTAPATLAEAAGQPVNRERDLLLLGDADRPLVEVPSLAARRLDEGMAAVNEAGEGAARGLAGAADDAARAGGPETITNTEAVRAATDVGPVYINWGRINTADDVQAIMRDMADAFRPQINEARRGIQTNEETARLAAQLGVSVEDILSRQAGSTWNAETALAARQLYTASGEQLVQAARAAASGGELEQAAFRRMMATHYAIQAQVLAARTETARALQAWSIPAGSSREQLQAIQQLIEGSGGSAATQAMARRLALLADNLPPDQLAPAMAAFTRRGALGASLEAVQEVWINALLSSPTTHVVNVTSNAANTFLQIAERAGAARISALRGADAGDGVVPGEALAMTYGMMTGLRDAMRLAARTYTDDSGDLASMLGKVDLPRDPAVSARAFGVDAGSGLGSAIDFIGHSIVRQPTRVMGAEDAFFKSILFRMELHASSLREGTARLVQRGEPLTQANLQREMRAVMQDPPEAVRMAAADAALYATFNRQAGPIAQSLLRLRNTESAAWNTSVTFVLPFIRTPMNILSYSFERTPLAPLVSQWRADVAAGGARRDLALTRMAMGTTMMAMGFDLADQGMITGRGPDDPAERANWERLGIQPYSVRIGGAWVSYNRLDPFGFLLGFAGDMADMVRRAEVEPDEVDEINELMGAAAVTISRAVLDRSWMTGAARFFDAIDQDQPKPEGFMGGIMGSLAAPGIVAFTERAVDPTQRETMGMEDYVLGRIPGLSDRLIPRRNLWGDEQRPGVRQIAGSETAADIVNALNPAPVSPVRDSPVDREMVALNLSIEGIGRRVTFSDGGPSVAINMREFPQALDELRRLAGNELRLEAFDNKGLRDALNDMVQGRGPMGETYLQQSTGEDGGRSRMIRRVVETYRDAAKREVLSRYPELRAHVMDRTEDVIRGRLPTGLEAPSLR